MHDPWTTNYATGYEWFLIEQAKTRNPDIKLYGLPWAFPQWVSCNPGSLTNCTNNPYDRPQQTASYITSWAQGLKSTYSFDLDYVGSWNEVNSPPSLLSSQPLPHALPLSHPPPRSLPFPARRSAAIRSPTLRRSARRWTRPAFRRPRSSSPTRASAWRAT